MLLIQRFHKSLDLKPVQRKETLLALVEAGTIRWVEGL